MKQIYKVVLLLSVIVMASTSFAGNKKQTFVLHVNSITKHHPAICFSTSDIFGALYCGDGAEARYAMGPKNWALSINDPDQFTDFYYEGSCYNFFTHDERGFPKRSPKENGQLDIYVNVKYRKFWPTIWLYDCHSKWTPAS